MKRDSLAIEVSLSAYLTAAIKYKVINYIEHNVVEGNYLSSLDKARLDYDNSTCESIMARDQAEVLDSGVQILSPKVRQVFELSRKENLSIAEIADRLRVSDQTVKNQISKALKVLRLHFR